MSTDSSEQERQDEVGRIESLLKQPSYSPREAAEVLGMRERTINSAVWGGELKAHIVNRDIVSIDRSSLIEWMRRRG